MMTDFDAIRRMGESEEAAVRDLGSRIGYGRTMQLCEQLWEQALVAQGLPKGGAHSVGPCTYNLVACPCPKSGRDRNGHCEWCCGSGRVTKKVFQAMQA